MPELRPIAYIVGILLVVFGLTMLIPAAADAIVGNPDWRVFVASAAFTVFAGGSLFFACRGGRQPFSLRQAFLLTSLTWIALSACGALPFLFSVLDLDYADAFFEAVSGLTTTGATVLVGLDTMPPGILLWRGLLQWMGGLGIIVMALAILPLLRVGGMQLFRTESSDRSEKVLPRPGQIAAVIGVVYLGLSVLCALAYRFAGMNGFEAIVHMMTTVATGGFSTSDLSIAYFDSPTIEWLACLFMILGALPIVLYFRFLRGDRGALWRNSQVHTLLGIVLVASLTLTLWYWSRNEVSILEALRLASFNVVSVITTTGYVTADYSSWGGFAVATFFLLMFAGGCTGSTSGGVKILRHQIIVIILRAHFRRMIHPHSVFPLRYNERVLPDDVPASVLVFFCVYLGGFTVLTLALAALGLDGLTAASGAATAVGNVGPGLGEIIGPVGNFASLPDIAKWLLSLGMLLGRLEFFTVLVLLLPRFWRD